MPTGTAESGLVCSTAILLVILSTMATFALNVKALDGNGTLAAPFTYWGQDTNGDGHCDYLWINASLTVNVQDAFRLDLRLNDSANTSQIAHATNDTYLLPGVHVIPMIINGYEFNSTPKWDGPYTASIKVFNAPGRLISWASDVSPGYLASDFESPPALAGKPFGDRGVDLDVPPDGLFNQLHVNLPVTFAEPGPFMVAVFIARSTPPYSVIASASLQVDASLGTFTYDMALGGISIGASGIDGPYTENGFVWALPDAGPPVQVAFSLNTSQPYLASNFQTRTIITVTGTVTDDAGNPLPGVTVAFANYTDLSWTQTATNLLGRYSLSLYAGDFIAAATRFGYSADNVTKLTVTGAGPYDFVIRCPPPSMYVFEYVMTDADTIDWASNGFLGGATSSSRMMADWNFGNKDGHVSAEESMMFTRFAGNGQLTDDTDGSYLVDGVLFYPSAYAGNVFELDFAGPVLSQLPATATGKAHYSSNSSIPRQVNHLIRLNASYDNAFREARFTLKLPPRWIAVGHDPLTNMTVTGLGTNTVIVDPLGNPNLSGHPDYAWVNITAIDESLVPPTIQGEAAAPDPQDYMRPVLISAWVNDSSPIAGANVSVYAPTAGFLGNFAMSYNVGSGRFEYQLSDYPDLGSYSFAIWATDTDGNAANASGTFVIHDVTAPVADAGPDQTVKVGATVTLNGTGSTDNFRISNWTWTFSDGGANITLYGQVVAHVFGAGGTYTVTLTVRDVSGNQGTDIATVTVETVEGGDPIGLANIPTSWALIIIMLNALSGILTGILASFFLRWHRFMDGAALGNIALGFCILAISSAFGVAFQTTTAFSPGPQTRMLLLASLSLETLAFSFVGAGYCLWKQETKASWLRVLLISLLILIVAVAVFYALSLPPSSAPDLSAMMQYFHGANLVVVAVVAAKSLQNYAKRLPDSAATVPVGFGFLAIGQLSMLIWSLDGSLIPIVFAAVSGLLGLVLLLKVILVRRRPS